MHFRKSMVAGCVLSAALAATMFSAARACETVAGWKAPLSGKSVVPAVTSPGGGIASFDFALDQPQATVTLDTTGLKDVTEIDLRHGYVGGTGPVVAQLYTSADGSLPAHLVKTMNAANVPVNAAVKVKTFSDFVMMIINGGMYVQVCTKSHPDGEVRGQVTMIKQRVFSTNEDGRGHDPKLHASAVQTSSTASTEPGTPAAQ